MPKSNSFKALVILGVIVLTALLIGVCAGPALAQEASDTAEVGISIGTLEVLSTHGDISFGTATGIGYTSTQTGDITAKRNTNWKVTIQADTATWNSSGGGRADKPCSHLEYQGGDVGTWTALSTSPATVKSDTPGDYTWQMSYRTQIVWADTPGNYDVDVTFTLTSN